MRKHGWRILLSPKGRSLDPFGFKYALDNGAWHSHLNETPFDEGAFVDALERVGGDADWVVSPDIVCGGQESLRVSLSWLEFCMDRAPMVLIAIQDGFSPEELRPYLGSRVGLFQGGSTEWKEATMPIWGRLARETGCYFHVGRVNSVRRARLCHLAGAHSFDGTSVTKYAVNIGKMTRAAAQKVLPFGEVH
jgi:hypothetical protein